MSRGKVYYSRCDIREYRQLDRLFANFGLSNKQFEYVFNCAAEFGRWNGEDFYEKLWETNVIGLRHILEMQKIYGFKLIHFSSSEVYGEYADIMTEDVMNTVEIKQLNDYAL